MTGYLVNFAIYTMAMLGLIFFALMVYKKFAAGEGMIKQSRSRMLSVEETISLAPRKTLYVVKAGNERFLIAGDIDKTTLISKLDYKNTVSEDITNSTHRYNNDIPVTEQNFAYNDTGINQSRDYIREAQTIKSKNSNYTNSIDELPNTVRTQRKSGGQSGILYNMLNKING